MDSEGYNASMPMLNRRGFLTSALAAASGLMVPDWIQDPLKGRSMIAVPGLPKEPIAAQWVIGHHSGVIDLGSFKVKSMEITRVTLFDSDEHVVRLEESADGTWLPAEPPPALLMEPAWLEVDYIPQGV